MAKYFLKLSGSNNIESIIEWDGASPYTPPPGYFIQLVTTTASINYVPSASKYEEPIFGGKLFGEFSGELNPSVEFNGELFVDLFNKTPYGTLTLYSSSMNNIFVSSGSFKISGSKLFLPLRTNENEKYPYIPNYSSSFAKIINDDIKNYVITLKNDYIKFDFFTQNTQITSSVSASITNQYFEIDFNSFVWSPGGPINTSTNVYTLLGNEKHTIDDRKLKDLFLTNFNVDFDLNQNFYDILKSNEKSTKYGRLLYNEHTNNTDPGSGYFSINSSTVWSEATELYVSLDNYEKNIETSSSKYELYNSTINDLFYEKIIGSKIKIESDVVGDNTYKIFEITDVLIVTSSGDNYAKLKVIENSSHTDGLVLLSLGQKFNVDFELLTKQKRQIDIVSSSKSFYTPYWAKDVIVMAIGAGGGGGGGVTAKQNHQFAVGGAGGGGGSISYTRFNNLSGSVRIDCFVGKAGLGGSSGSSDIESSYGKICPTCEVTDYPITQYIYKPYPLTTASMQSISSKIFDFLDLNLPTGSFGFSGGSTFAYVYDKNYTSLLGKVSAPGGIGGSFGYSLGITGSISGSDPIHLIVSNSISPISLPGGTNKNNKEFFGSELYSGGPGGYGISLPQNNSEKYSNYAPSLPWESNEYLTKNLLTFPFGINHRRTYGSNNNGNPIIIIRTLRNPQESKNNGNPIIILKTDGSDSIPLTGSYFNFDKPSNVGVTGGGGGNGWITGSLYSESDITLGQSGKLNVENKIFEYPISIGGNGGNRSTLNGLNVQLPQTGSGPGAGGGGGASDVYGGSAQNGANGVGGAVVIISMG